VEITSWKAGAWKTGKETGG